MISLTENQITANWDYNKPLVSIRCTTYRQESFIGQCLDGFLMQKTNFPFEIIVHDDASPDKTAEIIRQYEIKYPNIIKPIYEKENQYSKRDGSMDKIISKHLSGKYLATCEGDDYWCNEGKLQQQFDFLEMHPEYSVVGHLTKSVDLNGKEVVSFIDTVPGEYSYKNHEEWHLFSHWSSIFCINFYNFCTSEEMDQYYACKCPGDRKLILLLMKLGKAYVLPNTFSVYRFQSGQSSFTNSSEYLTTDNLWKEGFYLSQYANSLGFDFKYKDRQNKCVAFALLAYLRGKDKKSYITIKKMQGSSFLTDFVISLPILITHYSRKIRHKNEQ